MLSKVVEQCLYAKLNLSDEEYMNEYKSIRHGMNQARHSNEKFSHALTHGALHALAGGAVGGGLGSIADAVNNKKRGYKSNRFTTNGAAIGATLGGIHGAIYGWRRGKRIAKEGDKAFHEATAAHLKKYASMKEKDRLEYRNNYREQKKFEREMAQRKREADQRHYDRMHMTNMISSLGSEYLKTQNQRRPITYVNVHSSYRR